MVLTNKFLSLLIIFTCTIPARLNIVTSITDIADIAKNVGGDSVAVFSLAKGSEDMHRVRVRSSYLPKINRAHFVMSLGLFAESFWLKPLVSSSRNSNVKQGNPGWVEVYKGIEILEKPTEEEAKTMLHHKKGNPHYNNGPYCGKYMAENIYKALLKKDPKNKEYYTLHYNNYIKKLAEMEKKLIEKAAPLKGVHVISYHADLAYFCKFYGMVMTGCLEPKPGLAPTTRHLARLVVQAKKDKTKLILYHQAQNPRLPKRVADKTGAELVCFANMVKSRENIRNYIQLHYFNLDLMLNAVKKYNSK
jgi:zinc/manganese transport system substrate-binding protein